MADAHPDKLAVFEALRQQLARELETVTASQKATQSGATHAESRAENDKDTRALESSYLARGLARRVEDMREAVAALDALKLRPFEEDGPIALAALVVLEDGKQRVHHFIAPVAGGVRVESSGTEVVVVTPKSPLGRSLIGKFAGDDVDIRTPGGTREWTVASVS